MNKIIRMFLAVCVTMSAICIPSFAEKTEMVTQTDGIYTYEASGNNATITNIADTQEEVIIPEKLGEYTVTEIAAGACGGSKKIKMVVIPDTVTTIGSMCFAYSSSLTEVKLPSGLKTIEDGAFYQCESLWTITIPEGTTSIRQNAFAMCSSLTAATVPHGTTEIAPNAFARSGNLRIYAKVDSAAHKYATEHNTPFEELINVKVNDELVVFDQPCITDTTVYRTLTPMRKVLEALDGEVKWDNTMNMARINVMGHRLIIRPDEPFMMVDDRVCYLSSPAVEFNNRILIPIRDVAEAIGGKVMWNETEKLVTITCELEEK